MLKTTDIESLPEDIIFKILVRVPARDICNAAKKVCRTWRRMICTRVFAQTHLQQSTPGLLVYKDGSQPIFLATPKGQSDISNVNCEFTSRVLSSCNGLALERCGKNYHCRDVCITNPSTKQHIALPSFPLNPYTSPRPECCAIAYAAADMVYKVVAFFFSNISTEIECAILTVGVDTDWGRRVSTQHLTLASSCYKFRHSQRTLTTQGFVHLTDKECSDFWSLNVETEVITQFSVPAAASRRCDGRYYNYLATGSNLSLLIELGDLLWEVWEMRPETGEWTQMPYIDLEPHHNLALSSKLKLMRPVDWLSFREVLVFYVYDDFLHIAYNVRTQEIVSTDLGLLLGTYILPHINSLLWL